MKIANYDDCMIAISMDNLIERLWKLLRDSCKCQIGGFNKNELKGGRPRVTNIQNVN